MTDEKQTQEQADEEMINQGLSSDQAPQKSRNHHKGIQFCQTST